MGNPSPRYTAEFKQRAVEPCRKLGATYAEVALGLGCDADSLADWAKKADASGCFRQDRSFMGGTQNFQAWLCKFSCSARHAA